MSNSPPQLGKYRLIAELGRGGMAIVYLAVTSGQSGLDFSKLVVIKRLREHVAADPDFVVMLQDEARLAARLNHQNVVQTIEIGEQDGELFLAMEFLDGQPFQRIRKRAEGTLSLGMQLTIISDVLAGMHYAHELRDFDGTALNIVHRDITPHNIFVTYDGQVKVLDFGIAKAEGRSSSTKHGVVKGKLSYMAPEQARGKVLDRRTDIFSAGVMLYEAVTGKRYWELMSESEMLRTLMKGQHPRSPRARVPTVPIELDAICQKALAADPDDRYATADEFEVALDEYMSANRLRVRPRQIGTWLSELFADRRALTQSTLEEQIELVRVKPTEHEIISLTGRVRPPGDDDGEVDIDIDRDDELDDEGSGMDTRLLAVSPASSTESLPLEAPPPSGTNEVAGAALTTGSPATDAAARDRMLRLALFAALAVAALLVIAMATSRSSTDKTDGRGERGPGPAPAMHDGSAPAP